MKINNVMYSIICKDKLDAPMEESGVLYADDLQWAFVHELAYTLSILNPQRLVVIMSYAYGHSGAVDTAYFSGEQYECDDIGTFYRYDGDAADASCVLLQDSKSGIIRC